MNVRDYIEAIGIVLLAILCAIVGHVFSISFLDSAAPMLFGAALGYLLKQFGVQLPPPPASR